jgi:hypothetical protein
MRMAVASRALGIPMPYFGKRPIRSQRLLVADALKRSGLYPSAESEFFAPARPRNDAANFGVYLLGAVGEGIVKVGFSADPVNRIGNISQQVPFEIVRLAMKNGADMGIEKIIHVELQQWQRRGEWFYLTDESLAVLERHFGLLDAISIGNVLNGTSSDV